jgi:hypothetical protein
MADKETIDALLSNLKKALESGQELNASEVPYLVIKGEIDGKGILWSGHGYNKQFIFSLNPDRFFSSESIDLAKNKNISINGLPVISSNELGSSVAKSSLKEVGRLKGLIVDGSVSVNSYLYYDSVTDRLGIGTENPKAILDLVDQNVEILIGASSPNVGSIGTFNSQDFSINTDNTSRLTVAAGGDILLGNRNSKSTNVTVLGTLAVNVNQIDPRAQFQVSGPIKFNNKLHLSGTAAPDNGVFNEGDIVWNSNPQPGRHVGWICTRAGTPGLWNPFGRID